MHDETLEEPTHHATSTRRGRTAPRQGPGPRLMGANTLIGNDVFNDQDEDLGEIREIMLDMHTGRVDYAVLSFGGFLGMGEKLFAVPWAALELDTTSRCFVLRVSKARLESAPGFDKQHWPDMADPEWEKGVHEFYGTQPDGPAARDR
ncbi:PRC-barrel domain-containing protein [Hydrogenophaga sp.]|uniref:PRC-barrel domain-containing protein n=1 Tax=Hydrogenophaga sp. TaxID=1904254 RepID=UPI0025C25E9D|nr:PRC-barrel domain-containing protein [Hydrogenophaga sp.]MBT9465144.1 PRC-barrel domain-containing protein [Hydrogenophaga sp.]